MCILSLPPKTECLGVFSKFTGVFFRMSKVNGPIQGCHYLYMNYLGIVFAKNRKYIFRKKKNVEYFSEFSGFRFLFKF